MFGIGVRQKVIEIVMSSGVRFRGRLLTDKFLDTGLGVKKRYRLEGIKLDRFRMNPVLLKEHDTRKVIGSVENLKIEEYVSNGGSTKALYGDFVVSSATQVGRETLAQLKDGSLRALSVGLGGLEAKQLESDDKKVYYSVEASDLLELSVVGVPRDPEAVVVNSSGERMYGEFLDLDGVLGSVDLNDYSKPIVDVSKIEKEGPMENEAKEVNDKNSLSDSDRLELEAFRAERAKRAEAQREAELVARIKAELGVKNTVTEESLGKILDEKLSKVPVVGSADGRVVVSGEGGVIPFSKAEFLKAFSEGRGEEMYARAEDAIVSKVGSGSIGDERAEDVNQLRGRVYDRLGEWELEVNDSRYFGGGYLKSIEVIEK